MASFVCKSLNGLISTLTQGLLVQLCCGEGETLQTNITGMCGECSQCLSHIGFALAHCMCAFLVYTAQTPARELLKRALDCMHFQGLSHPDSGFQVLHKAQTPLGLHFVPFPGWATRCLASTLSPGVWFILSPPWSQPLSFLGLQWEHCLRCVKCLLWGADPWL